MAWKADYKQTTADLNIGTVAMTFTDGLGYSFRYTEDNINRSSVAAFKTRALAAMAADKAEFAAIAAINGQLEAFFNS